MAELGYYDFDITPIKDLIKVVHLLINMRFNPKNITFSFCPDYIKKVRALYIYGELIPRELVSRHCNLK